VTRCRVRSKRGRDKVARGEHSLSLLLDIVENVDSNHVDPRRCQGLIILNFECVFELGFDKTEPDAYLQAQGRLCLILPPGRASNLTYFSSLTLSSFAPALSSLLASYRCARV
jgi:hypothetical protein